MPWNTELLYPAALGWSVKTGTGDSRTTRSATLPRKKCFMPVRPCVPITIRSMFCAAVRSRISGAAFPLATKISCEAPASFSRAITSNRRMHSASNSGLGFSATGGSAAAAGGWRADHGQQANCSGVLLRQRAGEFERVHRVTLEVNRAQYSGKNRSHLCSSTLSPLRYLQHTPQPARGQVSLTDSIVMKGASEPQASGSKGSMLNRSMDVDRQKPRGHEPRVRNRR